MKRRESRGSMVQDATNEELRSTGPPPAQRPSPAVRVPLDEFYSPVPHDLYTPLPLPRYEIEAKLFIYKRVACVSSRSMSYASLLRASRHFQEVAICSIVCDATPKQYKLNVFDDHFLVN